MHPVALWFVGYAVPAIIGASGAVLVSDKRRSLAILNIAGLASIATMIFFGARLFWPFDVWGIVAVAAAAVVAVAALRWFGMLYALSSIFQEWCLLLAAVISMKAFGVIAGPIATSSVYSLAHLVLPGRWDIKIPVTFVWGVVSIFLYTWLLMPLMNIAVHMAGGAFFLSKEWFSKDEAGRSIRTV